MVHARRRAGLGRRLGRRLPDTLHTRPVAYRDPNPPASAEDVAALRNAATDSCDRALVALVARAGLRPHDACALTVDDVRASGGALRPGRGVVRPLVLLAPEVAEIVRDAAGDRPTGPLLVEPDGTALTPQRAVARLRRLADAANLHPPPTLPQLRAYARRPRSTL